VLRGRACRAVSIADALPSPALSVQ
jgi:hypothetical protein